jgi:hypothetical protein
MTIFLAKRNAASFLKVMKVKIDCEAELKKGKWLTECL